MDLKPGQRLKAPHPDYAGAPVEVVYIGPGPDWVHIVSHHPPKEERRRRIRVRYADKDARYEDHEYLVERDGVELIND